MVKKVVDQRKKKTQKKPNSKPKQKPLEDEDVIDNENINENIYDYIESNFNRVLSSIEIELVDTWEDNELTRYAIKEAVLNGAKSMKYIQAILNNWKDNGITTLEQAKGYLKKRKHIQTEDFDYDWLNEDGDE